MLVCRTVEFITVSSHIGHFQNRNSIEGILLTALSVKIFASMIFVDRRLEALTLLRVSGVFSIFLLRG